MPIYMDRHDISEGVTAEMVAQIHQEDLKIQDQYGCRGLTYWFDEKRNTAFCLIDAPNLDAIQRMHNDAHGQVPTSIIEVSAELVESFLGRIEDPEKTEDTELNIIKESAFRAIMIISLKQPAPKSSAQFKSLLPSYNDVILDVLSTYKGNIVKQTENYFLVSFKSVTNAVRAALDLQGVLNNFRKEMNTDQDFFKIGLSAGVPVNGNKSFFEDTVKMAERMCKIIKGDVIVSSDVKELYDSENFDPINEDASICCLTAAEEKFFTALMDYAESTFIKTNLQMSDFSKALACSKSQLYRKITSLTGKSPNNFIMDYRLNEALTLLNKNAGNITEIAYQTGFSSPSYFSKCFKKKYGHLPFEYVSVKAGAN